MNSNNQEFRPIWVAGFMSGTSIDAVDAALIRTDGESIFAFGPVAERPYSQEERAVLHAATDAARAWNWQGVRPESAFAAARKVIVKTHLDAWHMLRDALPDADISPEEIELLGVHGQTVLHRRPQADQLGETLQLMNAPEFGSAVNLPIAYDFRSADVAAGGEGAPLAPAYHNALMTLDSAGSCAILNLGGVANITGRAPDGALVAFDTGPANGPIDEWITRHSAGTYDLDGRIASIGQVDNARLRKLLEHAWFDIPPPKSLDRYDFSAAMVDGLSLADGAATLTAFTAQSVARGVQQLGTYPERVIACGGGRRNPFLMQQLAAALDCPIMSAEQAGWRGDSIEAEAFAFLAARTVRGLPLSWPGTTGVPKPQMGGKVYTPHSGSGAQ